MTCVRAERIRPDGGDEKAGKYAPACAHTDDDQSCQLDSTRARLLWIEHGQPPTDPMRADIQSTPKKVLGMMFKFGCS